MNIEHVTKAIYFGIPSIEFNLKYLNIDFDSVYEVKIEHDKELTEKINLYISDDSIARIKITVLQDPEASEAEIVRKITSMFKRRSKKTGYCNIWNLDNNITITLILNEQLVIEQFK